MSELSKSYSKQMVCSVSRAARPGTGTGALDQDEPWLAG